MKINNKVEQLRLIGVKYIDHPDFAKNAKAIVGYSLYDDPDAFEPHTKSSKDLSSSNVAPYLSSLRDYRVLTRQAERRLFMKYNCLKYQAACLLNLSPTTKRLKSIESYLESALSVRNIIVTHNLRLVVSIVKKWPMSEKSLEEYISDGNFWMITAIDSFDAQRGFKFSTYLSRVLTVNSWRRKRNAIPIANGESVECLPITDDHDPFFDVETLDSITQLREAIKSELNGREVEILDKRFGLRGSVETLDKISTDYGITIDRVRQIQAIAIKKLRSRVV